MPIVTGAFPFSKTANLSPKTLNILVAAGPAPLSLAAAKSVYGHAETGAGAVGLSRALAAVTGGCQHTLLHLRSLNPYVINILEAAAAKRAAESAGLLQFPSARLLV